MRWLAPALLLFACLPAHATSCIEPVTVCSSFEKHALAFRGRVLEVIQQPKSANDITCPGGCVGESVLTQDFRFEVLEVFKGNPGGEIVITGGYGEFDEGKEYIVYASPSPDMRKGQTSICSGDHLIENSDQDSDLAWLRAYPTAPPTSSIFGKVIMGYGVIDIPSIKIKLAGEESLTASSSEDHSYTFKGLRPGKYTLTATLPAGYVPLEKDEVAVTVAAKGCAEVDWAIRHDTHIRGTVTDTVGSPVSGERIGLLKPAQNRTGFDIVVSQRTDAGGNYDFSKVQPGDYWLALDYLGPDSVDAHAPVFYPSGADSSAAELIRLGPSADIENIDLVANPALHPVSLHVHVINPDGTPVIGAHVAADDPLTPTQFLSATADENGDAYITLYEGREYRLIASTSGHHEPFCAGPIKFIAKDGLQLGTLTLDKTWDQCRRAQDAK